MRTTSVERLIKDIKSLSKPEDLMAINQCVKKATATIRRTKQEKVFLCFNIRKGKIINQSVAKEYARFVKDRGYLPIAPYLMFKGIFDTQIMEEREELESISSSYLEQCSEMWVIGSEVTRIMTKQIDEAISLGITVRYFDENMEELL